jgi:hypothetical protein
MAIVYIHNSKDTNEVFYVGIGKHDKRAYSRCNRSKYWHNACLKHGIDVKITHRDISWQEACCIEKYLISFWREHSKLNLCNLTDGGDGVSGLKVSEERKKRYSEIFSGVNNPYYGKKHSEEARKKISQNQNPRKNITEEHKSKISKSNRGKKRTEETKIKLSNLKKGKITWNKGIACREETRKKLSESLKKYHNKTKNEIHHGRQANATTLCLEGLG